MPFSIFKVLKELYLGFHVVYGLNVRLTLLDQAYNILYNIHYLLIAL